VKGMPFARVENVKLKLYNSIPERGTRQMSVKKGKGSSTPDLKITSVIDFSQLMDLRVDYAFKLLFGAKDTRYLISLINAVFSNKNIPRVIKSLTVINPNLEKNKQDDKLSILDIRAQLEDMTSILIEMHLYDMISFKQKTIRSWARAYSEELSAGQDYTVQPPVICISFVNSAINDMVKIHSLYQIYERDDHDLLSDAMEMHYINMKAFIDEINEKSDIVTEETLENMFTKWLAVITQKEIKNKAIIEEICKEEEEIRMAVTALNKYNEDKYARQAYQRRMDELVTYNWLVKQAEQAETERQRAETAETEVEKLRMQIVELQSKLKDTV
jgi:predicted transposase/invertase (TIGR01784 family)